MNRNQTDFLDKLDALFREFNIEAVTQTKNPAGAGSFTSSFIL